MHPPRPGTPGRRPLASSATRARPRCDSRDRHHVATWHRAHPELLVDSPIVTSRTAGGMGVRRLAVGPSTLGLPSVGFIPCRCGRDSISGPCISRPAHRSARRRALPWTSARRARGRGRRAVVPWRRPFDGEESDRVELSLVLGPGRPPTELVGELVRATAELRPAPAPAGSSSTSTRRAGRRKTWWRPPGSTGCGPPGRCGRRAVARRDCRADALPSQRQCRAHAPSRRHRHAQRGGPVTAVRSPLDAWPGPPDGPAPRPPCRSTSPSTARPRPAPQSPVAEDSTPGPGAALSPSLAPAIRTRSTRRWSSPIRCRTSRAP